ncbi:MAG: hypothetical protein ABI577_12575 [bacterium]
MAEFSKSALDRLGERLRSSERPAHDDRATYDAYRASFAPAVIEVERLCADAIPFLQGRTARLKTLESTIAKLRRGSYRLSQIQDVAGVRIAVDDLSGQEVALEILGAELSILRITDYRDRPQNGYRALHLIVESTFGPLVELQLRTEVQDIWANTCETLAGMLDLGIKYGGGPDWIREALGELSRNGQEGETVQKYRQVLLGQIGAQATESSSLPRTDELRREFDVLGDAFLESYTQEVRDLVWRAGQQRQTS